MGICMKFSFASLFRTNPETVVAQRLYSAIVARAREPGLYEGMGIPDTAVGRFASISLHGFLVMDRLGGEQSATALSQRLFDVMFTDMDRNLREMGVGDLSVGKKVKRLAASFYELSAAIRRGLVGDDSVLAEALVEHVYGGQPPSDLALISVIHYIRTSVATLAAQPLEVLAKGAVAYAPLPPGK